PVAAPPTGRGPVPRGPGRARPHRGYQPQRPADATPDRGQVVVSRKDAKSAKETLCALCVFARNQPSIMPVEPQSGGTSHATGCQAEAPPVAAHGDATTALPPMPGGAHVSRHVRDERPLPGLRPRLRARAGLLLRGDVFQLRPVRRNPRAVVLLAPM